MKGKRGKKKRKRKKKPHRKIQAQPARLQSFAEIMCWVMHVPGGDPAWLLDMGWSCTASMAKHPCQTEIYFS